MNALAFGVALAALTLPMAAGVALGSYAALPLARRLSPVARAELAAWMVLLPALAVAVLVGGVVLPSGLHLVGLGADHCEGHGHHAHLCLIHGAELPGWAMASGLVGLVVVGLRTARVGLACVGVERLAQDLRSVGRASAGVLSVPASVPMCHTVGVLRPTVVISRALTDRLAPDELEAAIAHERAHVLRGDTRWAAALALVDAFGFSAGWLRVWREAAEEAADDLAAQTVGRVRVARALVSVARLGLPVQPGLALTDGNLERRVVRLLGEGPSRAFSVVGVGAMGLACLAVFVVGSAHGPLHHAAEEVWAHAVGHPHP